MSLDTKFNIEILTAKTEEDKTILNHLWIILEQERKKNISQVVWLITWAASNRSYQPDWLLAQLCQTASVGRNLCHILPHPHPHIPDDANMLKISFRASGPSQNGTWNKEGEPRVTFCTGRAMPAPFPLEEQNNYQKDGSGPEAPLPTILVFKL